MHEWTIIIIKGEERSQGQKVCFRPKKDILSRKLLKTVSFLTFPYVSNSLVHKTGKAPLVNNVNKSTWTSGLLVSRMFSRLVYLINYEANVTILTNFFISWSKH